MSYRVPESEFHAQPWRIHEVATGFEVEDVWQLPGTEPLSSFPRVVEAIASMDPTRGPGRMLWSARSALGSLFGWDDDTDGIGSRVISLRERLPDDLRNLPIRADRFVHVPFEVLLDLPDEFAAELANKTVHGLLHLGAVPTGEGRTTVQLTVLVKPNGRLGRAYLFGIKPFRHALIYPVMMRRLAKRWHDSPDAP
jgi:hypothetical protein